jgi:elongation factor G
MTMEPLPPGSGFTFANEVADGVVPEEYVPAVEKGIKGSVDNGALAGFPVIDLKVTLTGGAYHEVDSSALAFEIASRAAMKEGLAKAGPKLLEPIMKVEVTPRDYMGDVIGDLNSRRGRITGQDQRGNAEVINAMVPLANMFGHARAMDALSQGHITFTMLFAHYERAPKPRDGDDDPPFGPAVGMRG